MIRFACPLCHKNLQILDERVKATQESTCLSGGVKRDLRTLAVKVRDANKFAGHPPTTYAVFSVKAKGFNQDMKEYVKRLGEHFKESEN